MLSTPTNLQKNFKDSKHKFTTSRRGENENGGASKVNPTNPPRKPCFKGETQNLNGNVFETLEELRNPLQFEKTLEDIQRYCSKTYR